MKAIRLRTEHLKEAMGVDFSHPELQWNCEGGIRQTAWRILAVSGKEMVWDSGKVAGSSMRAEYPHALSSRQRVAWKVKLWDEKDEEGEWSEEASFEMGLLSPDDWKAQWITGNYRVDPKLRYPVDCFQKKFTAKGVTKAPVCDGVRHLRGAHQRPKGRQFLSCARTYRLQAAHPIPDGGCDRPDP